MFSNLPHPSVQRIQVFSWLAMAVVLWVVLEVGLLGALVAGMAVYTSTHWLARRLPNRFDTTLARQVALAVWAAVFVGAMTGAGIWVAGFLGGHGGGPGVGSLMLRMADILVELKQILPTWMANGLPDSVQHFNAWAAALLTSHAESVQTMGQDLLKAFTRILIGMVVGGLVAVAQLGHKDTPAPLSQALLDRTTRFSAVFAKVVSAQLRISLVNTFFTAVFLAVALPLAGHPLPFTKTMILITFVAGLIPVLGNLISNTVITIIALSVSVWVAVSALAFLVVIHKLEYFLNARIIGGQIQARAWELLAAMLVMEACFGIAGVIAAPIYYAYLKDELRGHHLI